MQISLLVNAHARRGEAWFDSALAEFDQLGVRVMDRHLVYEGGELLPSARRLIAAGPDAVVVGGGDGTLSTVASAFVGTGATLGVLPLGTGNAFARDLGIPANLVKACSVVAANRTRQVDLGQVNQDYFVNLLTVGLTTHVARYLDRGMKRRWGRLAYLAALVRSYRKLRPFRVRLQAREAEAEFDCLQLVLGNGRYHAGPFVVSRYAAIDEGKLTLYAVRSTTRKALFRVAVQFTLGRHTEHPDVFHVETSAGRIEVTPKQWVAVDGEVCTRTPLDYAVAEGALKVLG